MEEILILVDENDNEIGRETREKCHIGKGKMHRALVVFLFNRRKMLLIQQRSQKKKLWPGYWDCTVATHVYPSETYEGAAQRALKQELGISATVKRLLAFTYFAPFGKHAENECCTLLVGEYEGEVSLNPNEVSNFNYASLHELGENMTEDRGKYTPWLKIALQKFLKRSHPKQFRCDRLSGARAILFVSILRAATLLQGQVAVSILAHVMFFSLPLNLRRLRHFSVYREDLRDKTNLDRPCHSLLNFLPRSHLRSTVCSHLTMDIHLALSIGYQCKIFFRCQ